MSKRVTRKAQEKARVPIAAAGETLESLKTDKKPMPVYLKDATEPIERGLARTVLRPSIGHAATLTKVLKRAYGDRGLAELAEELSEQCQSVIDGKLGRPEAMLTAQAHTLDALFGDLTRLAYCNWFTNLDSAERLMKLALRAQSQCRATLETLATIKNPPMVIARQANIAHGPQQVNNGSDTSTRPGARARENQTEQSKLLEQTHGERMDCGAASQAIGSDPAVATVGAFDRTEKRGR